MKTVPVSAFFLITVPGHKKRLIAIKREREKLSVCQSDGEKTVKLPIRERDGHIARI